MKDRHWACGGPLHDYPLPEDYAGAQNMAERRLKQGWRNTRCSACGIYGWEKPGAPVGYIRQANREPRSGNQVGGRASARGGR